MQISFRLPRLVGVSLVAALPLSLVSLVSRDALAQDRPTLSGTWSASAISERWNIGDWGEACGPKPAPHGAGGGTVTVTDTGSELSFSGGGYPRTTGCFEMGGGINVVSHGGGARGWKTRCATSPNDPRRATIVTTLTATDSLISFDETGEYQFVLKEQNCTASVRRSRTYSLVKRLGDDAPPPTATASAAPPPATTAAPPPTETAKPPEPKNEPKPARTCDALGEPARLEVRPSEKLLKPGETFVFTSIVTDAAGCRVTVVPTWSVVGDAKGLTVTNGTVVVDAASAEGPVVLQATVAGKSIKANVEIVSPDRFQEILSARRLNAAGENENAAVATLATGSVGGGSGEASDGSKARRFAFLGVVGLSVLSLGGVGLFLFRRSRGRTVEVEEIVQGETQMKVVKKKRMVAITVTGRKCPACGRTFPPNVTVCPHDGNKLEAITGEAPASVPGQTPGLAPTQAQPVMQPAGTQVMPGQAVLAPTQQQPIMPHGGTQAMPRPVAEKLCPACGRRYGANERFCGAEGATLIDAPRV